MSLGTLGYLSAVGACISLFMFFWTKYRLGPMVEKQIDAVERGKRLKFHAPYCSRFWFPRVPCVCGLGDMEYTEMSCSQANQTSKGEK